VIGRKRDVVEIFECGIFAASFSTAVSINFMDFADDDDIVF